MSERWHIAQMNVGTVLYPTGDPRLSGFMNQLDAINALADTSPGFVWRMQSDSGNATDIDVGGDPLFLANMSVWTTVEALFDFVYKTAHREVMIHRREWFEKPDGPYQVLWWVPAGHVPSAEEGLERLARLAAHGPHPRAFNFKAKFPPPGVAGDPSDMAPEPYCAATTLTE